MIKLYENIRNRRIELNLSQTELASRVGLKDKSSISRVENGRIDLTQSMIEEFAKALECSPAYLMGWTSNAQTEQSIADIRKNVMSAIDKIQHELGELKEQDYMIELSEEEKYLLESYRKANSDSKRRISKYIEMELNDVGGD